MKYSTSAAVGSESGETMVPDRLHDARQDRAPINP
jgi:hypothetical protein